MMHGEFCMNFVSDYDKREGVFTLTSLGLTGKPNTEQFSAMAALAYKVAALEAAGYYVVDATERTEPVPLYRLVWYPTGPNRSKAREVDTTYVPAHLREGHRTLRC